MYNHINHGNEPSSLLLMKNYKISLLGASLLCAATVFAQNTSPQPSPQELITRDNNISLPAIYQIDGEKEANPHAVRVLKGLLAGKQSTREGLRIYIGEKGDKSVRKYSRLIPDYDEGYYLSVNEKEIVLAGADERGTYYALQTFAQLIKNGRLPEDMTNLIDKWRNYISNREEL